MHRYSIVATARWEDAALPEWIEYHRSIGFDHFYIYGHDDEPLTLYHALFPYLLGAKPVVTYRYWPKPGQFAAMYLDFLRNHATETEWFGCFDIGEFLTLRHLNDVARFMAPFGRDWDAVSFHTLNFAPGPDVPGSVLLARTWRAEALEPRVKSLTRSAAIDPVPLAQGVNRGLPPFWRGWGAYGLPDFRECDVLGNPMTGDSDPLGAPGVAEAIFEKAVLHRIAFNTLEALKRRLGYGHMIDQSLWEGVLQQNGLDAVIRANSAVNDTTLADYWRAVIAPSLDFYAEPMRADSQQNIALGKSSWQSSVYSVQPGEPMAGTAVGGATNGRKTGTFGFHTELQANPWWVVDLRASYRLTGMRIYNRCDSPGLAARARRLRIEISQDSVEWKLLLASEQGIDFGGVADQAPLELKTPPSAVARYCKFSLDDTNYFHLDEVEIYGTPA